MGTTIQARASEASLVANSQVETRTWRIASETAALDNKSCTPRQMLDSGHTSGGPTPLESNTIAKAKSQSNIKTFELLNRNLRAMGRAIIAFAVWVGAMVGAIFLQ